MCRKKESKNYGLLEILCSPASIENVVDDWIAKYSESRPPAILELIQLLFDASGHNKKLTIEVIENEDPKHVIESLKLTMPKNKDAPISNKKVQVSLAVFFQRLIQKCNNILYDGNLLEDLFGFIMPMSRNPMRAFRLVSTLIGLKVMTALVNVLVVVSKDLSIAYGQLSAEEAKDRDSQSQHRMAVLRNKTSDLQSKEKDLTDMLQVFLIKLIFKPGILDKMPDIQVLCLTEGIVWMQIYPKMFMIDTYLAYYKLLMPSPEVSVREAVVKSLVYLYEKELYKEELRLFSEKCVHDLAMMTCNVSIPVSVSALTVLTHIVKMYGLKIVEKHNEDIFHLVFSKFRPVANEAGLFLLAWLEAQAEPQKSLSHVTTLIRLTEFFEEAHLPDHAPFMVEALLPTCAALVDWEAICSVLLQESDLSLEQETCFMKIVNAVVYQLCTGNSPRAPNAKPKMTIKAKQKREMCTLEITEYFAEYMPRLLHKHRDDAEKVVLLLQVIMHFRLDRITPAKQKIVNMLVKNLESLTEIHSEKCVLRGCCEVMKHIYTEPQTSTASCGLHWESIESRYIAKFIQTVEDMRKCSQRNTKPNEDLVFTLCNSLDKLVIFSEFWDLGLTDIWNITLNYIVHASQHSTYSVAFILNCIKICHLNVLWGHKRLESKLEGSITEDDVRSLKSKLSQLLYALQELLNHNEDAFSRSAFLTICDLLLIFCENCSVMYVLAISPSTHLQALLQKYVEKYVFRGDYVKQVKKGVNLELKKSILTEYCKLVSYGVLEIDSGVWIFKYYNKKFKDYENIIKKTFEDMLETDEIKCVESLMNVINHSFMIFLEERKQGDAENTKKILKDKHQAFCVLLAKHPNALAHFHELGILFSFKKDTNNRNNVLFFEVLSLFVEGLSAQQSDVLLEMVRDEEAHSSDTSKFTSVYQACLMEKLNLHTPKKRRVTKKQKSSVAHTPSTK